MFQGIAHRTIVQMCTTEPDVVVMQRTIVQMYTKVQIRANEKKT